MGVRVPRSRSKRCALREEKAKRLRIEQEHEETKERLQNLEDVVSLLLSTLGSIVNQSEIDDFTINGNTITRKIMTRIDGTKMVKLRAMNLKM
ncbi:unnamed protein product [Cuscuta campestris]|uniref:Uncharacterized protein n=1 Tax=Cuscuta campestris TaxID=132261 RepID=A0A484M1H4_9ASTE|nr:unnamed protein product [Cuscuta campestris]